MDPKQNLLMCLDALRCTPQDARHHPEGSALIHTLLAARAARAFAIRDGFSKRDQQIVTFAALCHDLGKAENTQFRPRGKITAYGHDTASAVLAYKLAPKHGFTQAETDIISVLVEYHHYHLQCYKRRTARRLERALLSCGASVALWAVLVEADYAARPPLVPHNPAIRVLGLLSDAGDEIPMGGES
jgi:tRNA nucleotidyltransferase (CCA-adding enzyme)